MKVAKAGCCTVSHHAWSGFTTYSRNPFALVALSGLASRLLLATASGAGVLPLVRVSVLETLPLLLLLLLCLHGLVGKDGQGGGKGLMGGEGWKGACSNGGRWQ